MNHKKEKIMQGLFFLTACISIVSVFLICVFLLANGLPAIKEIGIKNFLLGEIWRPSSNEFGIFPMIIGSIYVTAGAIIVGVPVGLLCAIYMAKFCPPSVYRIMKDLLTV